jgi:hypothetical protein
MGRYVMASVVFVAVVTPGAPSLQADGAQSSPVPQYSVQVLNFPAKYTQGGLATALNVNGDVSGSRRKGSRRRSPRVRSISGTRSFIAIS